MNKATLVLADGKYFTGYKLGSPGLAVGEVVFNTCMTGYQEVITDPSYKGQMVTMTYPLIGNYGLNDTVAESSKPQIEGLIVKEACEEQSGSVPGSSIDEYLKANGITGISGIDTRSLTRHIRDKGSMPGIISTTTGNVDRLLVLLNEALKDRKEPVGLVSIKNPIYYPGNGKRIALIDFGCKQSIITNLRRYGCALHVLPYNSSKEDILALAPDAIMLSNGPGDPAVLTDSIKTIRSLIGLKPVWGICLGLQLLGLSLGARTYKLKFGHHGGNHAVKSIYGGQSYITSQNHDYALDADVPNDILITEKNVNDSTVEGFVHRRLPVKAVQYHPEASPGPADRINFFKSFLSGI